MKYENKSRALIIIKNISALEKQLEQFNDPSLRVIVNVTGYCIIDKTVESKNNDYKSEILSFIQTLISSTKKRIVELKAELETL